MKTTSKEVAQVSLLIILNMYMPTGTMETAEQSDVILVSPTFFIRFLLGPTVLRSLTLNVRCLFESYIEIKIKLNLYFHFSLWYLKRFYEGL